MRELKLGEFIGANKGHRGASTVLLRPLPGLLALCLPLIVALGALVGCSTATTREQVLEGYVRQQVEDYGWLES